MLAQRPGSGDGEGWTLRTRQIAFEPMSASALLGGARLQEGFDIVGAAKSVDVSDE